MIRSLLLLTSLPGSWALRALSQTKNTQLLTCQLHKPTFNRVRGQWIKKSLDANAVGCFVSEKVTAFPNFNELLSYIHRVVMHYQVPIMSNSLKNVYSLENNTFSNCFVTEQPAKGSQQTAVCNEKRVGIILKNSKPGLGDSTLMIFPHWLPSPLIIIVLVMPSRHFRWDSEPRLVSSC